MRMLYELNGLRLLRHLSTSGWCINIEFKFQFVLYFFYLSVDDHYKCIIGQFNSLIITLSYYISSDSKTSYTSKFHFEISILSPNTVTRNTLPGTCFSRSAWSVNAIINSVFPTPPYCVITALFCVSDISLKVFNSFLQPAKNAVTDGRSWCSPSLPIVCSSFKWVFQSLTARITEVLPVVTAICVHYLTVASSFLHISHSRFDCLDLASVDSQLFLLFPLLASIRRMHN